jgi:transcriptional regulator with XRE-family HTH domain
MGGREVAPPEAPRLQRPRSAKYDRYLAGQADRRRKALELRLEGRSYHDIAKAMGVTRQAAAQLVRREIARIPREAADQCRELELARLDVLWLKALAVAQQEHPLAAGKGIELAIKISQRRSNLLGLDAPKQVQAGVAFGGALALGEVGDAETAAQIAEAYAASLRAGMTRPPALVASSAATAVVDVDTDDEGNA